MQKLLLNALAFLLSLLLKWLAKKFVPSDTKKTTKVAQVPKPVIKTPPEAFRTAKKKLINAKLPTIPMPTQEQIADRDMRLSNLRDRLKAEVEQSKQLGKYEIMNDPAIWKKGHKQEEGRVDKDGISKTSAQGSAEEAGS